MLLEARYNNTAFFSFAKDRVIFVTRTVYARYKQHSTMFITDPTKTLLDPNWANDTPSRRNKAQKDKKTGSTRTSYVVDRNIYFYDDIVMYLRINVHVHNPSQIH